MPSEKGRVETSVAKPPRRRGFLEQPRLRLGDGREELAWSEAPRVRWSSMDDMADLIVTRGFYFFLVCGWYMCIEISGSIWVYNYNWAFQCVVWAWLALQGRNPWSQHSETLNCLVFVFHSDAESRIQRSLGGAAPTVYWNKLLNW